MPTPPTSSATAPRPKNSPVNAPRVAALATSASDGRTTWTASGWTGFAVTASTDSTADTWSGSVRTYSRVGLPAKASRLRATGKPISAASSISGAIAAGARMPTTVK